jgi:hypothetical protein
VNPTPKLRWFQFSLRSLLLLPLFVAVLCFRGIAMNAKNLLENLPADLPEELPGMTGDDPSR